MNVQKDGDVIKVYFPKNRIKQFRQKAGLTQKQLGDMIHCSPQSISGFERGDISIRLDYCLAICLSLNATLDEIFWTFPDNIHQIIQHNKQTNLRKNA